MATIPEALTIAVQYHNSGQLQIAEQIYRQILQADPNHVDAIHLLGVVASQTGKPEVAVEYIRQAIRLNGDSAVFYCNLGNALKDQRIWTKRPTAIAGQLNCSRTSPKHSATWAMC